MKTASLTDIYNFRAVDESLCTSGQPSEDQFAAVADAGFEVVINLALHDDPRCSLADEAGHVAGLGMEYIHIPVQFDRPTRRDMEQFFAAMDRCAGRKAFLHCAANKRVSTFLGLYRVMKLGWAREPAFELMRGIWQPDAIWSAFIAEMLAQ